MRIELDFFGEDLVASTIVGHGQRAQDLRPAFRRVVKTLQASAERQFDTEGVYGSGGWAPLAPSTKRQKAAKGLDPRILHATGRLKGSLQGKNADKISRISRQSLVFGSYTSYAVFHVRGTARMPRRRPMQLTKGDRRLITRSIYERVMAEAGRF
jgi:phage gpG-like protein